VAGDEVVGVGSKGEEGADGVYGDDGSAGLGGGGGDGVEGGGFAAATFAGDENGARERFVILPPVC
jgi:hypothetical protein